MELTQDDKKEIRRLDSPGEPLNQQDVAISSFGLPYSLSCAAASAAKAALGKCGKKDDTKEGCCGSPTCHCVRENT